MKNTPIHVHAKTTFVSWPSTESRQISSFHNILCFNHYFRKYFKLVYKKFGYVNYKHQYNIPPIHLHALLDVRNFTKRSKCVPTTYEVVNYCLKFEEHWFIDLQNVCKCTQRHTSCSVFITGDVISTSCASCFIYVPSSTFIQAAWFSSLHILPCEPGSALTKSIQFCNASIHVSIIAMHSYYIK
jgi:hypothetical protein